MSGCYQLNNITISNNETINNIIEKKFSGITINKIIPIL
jgi:hypothetical protein